MAVVLDYTLWLISLPNASDSVPPSYKILTQRSGLLGSTNHVHQICQLAVGCVKKLNIIADSHMAHFKYTVAICDFLAIGALNLNCKLDSQTPIERVLFSYHHARTRRA